VNDNLGTGVPLQLTWTTESAATKPQECQEELPVRKVWHRVPFFDELFLSAKTKVGKDVERFLASIFPLALFRLFLCHWISGNYYCVCQLDISHIRAHCSITDPR
jgi:hypothetical protein